MSTHLYHGHRLSREHLLDIAGHGLESIELFATRTHFDYHNPSAVADLQQWLADAGLELHGVHAPITDSFVGGRWGPALTVASTEPEARAKAVAESEQALYVARRIPMKVLVVHLGLPRTQSDSPDDNSRDAARRSIDELRETGTSDRNPLEYVITNYTIFPATVLAGEPDHIEAWTVLPHASDTNRCQVVLRFLVQKLPETDREIRYRDRNWDILLGAVENEDWAAAQSINDSLPRGYVPEVVFGRNELPAQRYYSRMQAELDAAAESV